MNQRPLCIIPARGGSKRIPRKNIVDFNDKPMIAWSIETALHSGLFEQVIVSTDDDEIAAVAREHGAETPFMRSDDLADDFATTSQVLLDAIEKLPLSEIICCLYPTAPLVNSQNLRDAMQLIQENECDSVIATTEFDFHPLRGFEPSENGKLAFKWPQYATTRSQDLPPMMHDAGAFYLFRTAPFLQQQTLVMRSTIGYLMDKHQAIDIDTPDDLSLAESMHKIQLQKLYGQDPDGES